MKKLTFLFITLLLQTASLFSNTTFPPLTILLMVKNEEHVMQKTLQAYIDAGIQNFVILDTGSTDNTIQVTQDLFLQHSVSNAFIIEQPFIDFSTSRNYLIRQAEQLIPKSKLFLMIDAEWYIQNINDLLKFCSENTDAAENAFMVGITVQQQEKFFVTRLFKAHKNISFTGPVHEEVFEFPKKFAPSSTYFIYAPSKQGLDATHARNKRDLEMLLDEQEKNPTDYRTLYFLGQTYANLGQLEDAITTYEKAASIVDDKNNIGKDEKSRILFRVGTLYERQGKWEQAFKAYLQSFNVDSRKVEPLVQIAIHYLEEKKYPLVYLFAQHAAKIPCPEKMYIEKPMYEHTRYHLLAVAAWHMKQFEIGEAALKTALQNNPNLEHLQHNLKLYEQRKQLQGS